MPLTIPTDDRTIAQAAPAMPYWFTKTIPRVNVIITEITLYRKIKAGLFIARIILPKTSESVPKTG